MAQHNPLALLLIERHPLERRRAATELVDAQLFARRPVPQPSVGTADAIATAYQEGFEAGHRAGEDAADVGSKRAQSQLSSQYEQDLQRLAHSVFSKLDEQLLLLHESIAGSVRVLLQPLLVQVASSMAVDALIGELIKVLPPHGGVRIAVHGPTSFVAHVQHVLTTNGHVVEPKITEAVDLTVRFDSTVMETRLVDWIQLIEEQR
jgi:hypothetical protein